MRLFELIEIHALIFVCWHFFRVLELEKKKENVNAKAKGSVQIPSKPPKRAIRKQKVINNDSDTSEDEIGDIDEYLDWRSKKAYK